MQAFIIADEADQQFDIILNNRRVTIRLRHNETLNRWSFDLAISAVPVLHGRRVVTGVDLLAAFDFGIGLIFADNAKGAQAPGYDDLVNGSVKLFHATEADVEALS